MAKQKPIFHYRMEHLNKQQVVLTCLLVAIVTSITTGIITVSLLDQSGGGASQTIYQVIERTVEKVVPDTSPVRRPVETPPPPKEVPLSDIVDKAGKNIVRIYQKNSKGESTFVTIALGVGDKGALLGPKTLKVLVEEDSLNAVSSDGSEFEVRVAKTPFRDENLFFIKDAINFEKAPKSILGNFSALKLGSNVIALGGKENDNVVSTGIISEFNNSGVDNATSTSRNIVSTNITLSSTLAGWILLDTGGYVIGFAEAVTPGTPTRFFDASYIRKLGGEAF